MEWKNPLCLKKKPIILNFLPVIEFILSMSGNKSPIRKIMERIVVSRDIPQKNNKSKEIKIPVLRCVLPSIFSLQINYVCDFVWILIN